MKTTTPFVITISRQLGSGGSVVGQKLAKELSIFYADRDIISKAAQMLSVLEEDIESRDEKTLSFWQSFLYTAAFAPETFLPPKTVLPTDRELYDAEAGVIEHIAKERSAVIMGRCGFHILREHSNCVSIFLHANNAFRKDRIQKQYEVSEMEADKMIAQSDKERSIYCKTFTGKEWVDARNYNLSIDTGKIGIDKTVKHILNYWKLT
jgi:cytidylate kinase